ncbi:MAG: hypothetical protein IPI49_17800 [Myxococcales bacterium]|nr:hypothetical protein [Myxococcales bacterium]
MSSWNQIETQWPLLTAQVKAKWLKLTEEDLKAIAGRRDSLVSMLQERYGVLRVDAEKHVNNWADKLPPQAKDNDQASVANAKRNSKQGSNGNAPKLAGNGNGNARHGGATVAASIEPDVDAVTTKHVAAPGVGARPQPLAKPVMKHV